MSDYSNYDELVALINSALSEVNKKYENVGDAATTYCDINQIAKSLNIQIVRDNNGNVIGYDHIYTYPTNPNIPAMGVDSNVDNGQYGTATGGGGSTRGGGAGRFAGSVYDDEGVTTDKMKSTDLIASYITPEWGGVSVLSKLGKAVSDGANNTIAALSDTFKSTYNGLLTTWNTTKDVTTDAIRVLFGVDANGNSTMYMDEDTIGALAISAKENEVFENFPSTIIGTPTDAPPYCVFTSEWTLYTNTPFDISAYVTWQQQTITKKVLMYIGRGVDRPDVGNEYVCFSDYNSTVTGEYKTCFIYGNSFYMLVATTTAPNSNVGIILIRDNGDYVREVYTSGTWESYTYNNKTVYYRNVPVVYMSVENMACEYTTQTDYNPDRVAWYMVYGTQWDSSGGLPGITNQTGATIPVDAITGADPHIVAQNLASNYPSIMGSPIQVVTMDDSCNQVTHNYYSVPVSYSPTNVTYNYPYSGGTQNNPTFNPSISIDLPDINMGDLVDQIIDQLQGSGAGENIAADDPTTGLPEILSGDVPITGTGDTPESVLPETEVQGMWHVYNPSSAEVTQLGSWLWSANIIDQIIRLFVNPMEAIIGLHAIYGAPTVSSSTAIIVGNLTSTVSARKVTKQYTSVDCGSVWITEYFGNVFDYPPYTKISIFLPFIGIIDLDVNEVMRAELHVKYNIDTYTGACVAQINVNRDGAGGLIYQYAGQCAISYPVSAASYSRMLQSVVSAGLSAVSAGVMTGGNPIAGTIAAGTKMLSGGEKISVQHSGGFSGNAGAMGPKKPYLIISRPQTNLAINFEKYIGRGSNYSSRIGEETGFIKCNEVKLNIPTAYKNEIAEIESILKGGVFV